MPGVIAVYTAADLDLEARRLAVQPDGRPHAAGERQGALRRRAGRRRRRRDRRPRPPTPPRRCSSTSTSCRRWSTSNRPRSPRRSSTRPPARTSCSTRPCSACPRTHRPTSSSPTARSPSPDASSTSASRRARSRSVARRPRGSTVACTSGCRPSTPRAARPPIAAVNGVDDADGAHHHPRRGRRIRRQDRLVPRGAPARSDRQAARPPGALAGDPQRIDDGPRPRPRPGAVRHHRRHPRRQGHPLPTARDPGLRRLLRHGRDPGPVHDPADVVGRVRHPQHRGPHHLGRHQHHADRRLPRRRPSRGHRRHRTGDGPVRRRDRHGRRRRPPDEPDPASSSSRTPPRSARPTTSATTRPPSTRPSTAAGYTELRAEQAARRESGDAKQLGIGVSVYVEITGGVATGGRRRQDRGQRRRLAPPCTPAPRPTARATTRRGR